MGDYPKQSLTNITHTNCCKDSFSPKRASLSNRKRASLSRRHIPLTSHILFQMFVSLLIIKSDIKIKFGVSETTLGFPDLRMPKNMFRLKKENKINIYCRFNINKREMIKKSDKSIDIDCLMARTTCLVCLVSTVSGHSKMPL